MKTKSFFTIAFMFLISYSYGQINILNADSPEEIGKKTSNQIDKGAVKDPIPYGYVGDRDILWSKNTWEYIDLNQRVNFPLLYPLDTGRIGTNRLSLYHVLLKNIRNGKIKHVYADSYFTRERTLQELQATLHRTDTLPQGYAQLNAGEEIDQQFITHTDVGGADLQGFRIRGYWYFDKKQGALKYRLLGICPMVIGSYAKKMNLQDAQPVELFWVFYPAARKVLYNAKVFNPYNSAHPLNFDQILNARRFHAVIYKTDNKYGDRPIRDYIGDNALKQLLESRRIKKEIRAFEANMWNY